MSFIRAAKKEDVAVVRGNRKECVIMEVIGEDGRKVGELFNGGEDAKKPPYKQVLEESATL
jgi:hypothetical protein